MVDTGCPFTVCGEVWFKSYADSLSRKEQMSVLKKESHNKFRFGDGKSYPSQFRATIPIYISNSRYQLSVDVVLCDIPLLLSQDTLRRANAKIDVGEATINFMGITIPLNISSSGHMFGNMPST